MISFLRNIRRSFIDSRNLRKYLVYAIGEILLVMIGILLALQVNNWNEENKNRQLERVTLDQLKKDVVANISEIERVQSSLDDHILSINIILHAFENDLPYHDSLSRYFGMAMVYTTNFMHEGAYQSIKSFGTHVIRDEVLRFEISNYFDYSLERNGSFMKETRDDFYSYMIGYLRQEFKHFKSEFNGHNRGVPKDYEALKKNEDFNLSLGIFLDGQEQALYVVDETQDDSYKLLDFINHRLSQIGHIEEMATFE